MSAIYARLLERITEQKAPICGWFEQAYHQTPPCFYSSVDLRHSGFKLVPVDTNLFPAGFNHLSSAARERAVLQIKRFISEQKMTIQSALIIPENHTRNLGYLDNLYALLTLLEEAGLTVQIGSVIAPIGEPIELQTSTGVTLTEHPLKRESNSLMTDKGFTPDLIVINNDMTSGMPEILRGVTQLIVPQVGLGWYRRKKSIHFDAYARVAQQFSQAFNLDPWHISALFHKCGHVNFQERIGIECVALGVEKVLHQIREKYQQYGIAETPYVFIKADSGTYGMGIMTARSGDEIMEMNKKVRNKMNAIKEGIISSEVIIQEGVPTIDIIDGHQAEPMLYLVAGEHVGGAYRVNNERDQYGNLNAKGMSFSGMCYQHEATQSEPRKGVKECDFSVLGLIAKLATLAASREEYGEEYAI